MINRLLNPEKILYAVIVPLVGLCLYCAGFLVVSQFFVPRDVNYYFTVNLMLFLGVILVGFTILFTAVVLKKKTLLKDFSFHYAVKNAGFGNFGLVLLPMLPIVQYIINNQEILSFVNSAVILTVFLLLSMVLVSLLPILLGRTDSASGLAILGSTFTFTINSMALLSKTFFWYEKGVFLIQLMVFIAVLVFCLLFSAKKFSGLFNVLIISLLLINIVLAFFNNEEVVGDDSQSITESPFLILAAEKEPIQTPNIYLLIYDAYVGSETLAAYGIDNSMQESLLRQNGFTLYPQTYSIGAASIDSMSRVLNASINYFGNTRHAVSGGGVVQNALRENGYETYGIFQNTFFFRGIDTSYDQSFPAEDKATYATIIPAVLMGEFRFDFEFNQMLQQEFNLAKNDLFDSMTGTRFVYMHTYLPSHSQNSGVCLVNETELYAQRLAQANIEMEKDLEFIIKKDPGAIIIIAGDHGPYLTKNCTATGNVYDVSEISRLDIQDRYGTFLAIRWPDDNFDAFDEISVLQDVFPVIFAYMYEDRDFLDLKPAPNTMESETISGAAVQNGIIVGGVDDGEPLFLDDGE